MSFWVLEVEGLGGFERAAGTVGFAFGAEGVREVGGWDGGFAGDRLGRGDVVR